MTPLKLPEQDRRIPGTSQLPEEASGKEKVQLSLR